jgi:succinoglycan biosynthesis transport protein ExoP
VSGAYSFAAADLEVRLEEARKNFDIIILEGAPVMLVADSLVLGRQADIVLHVARWAHTPRRVVEAALRRMNENSLVVDGVVLTRVNLRRHRRLHLFDDCSFYAKEHRLYERMARHPQLRSPSPRERT